MYEEISNERKTFLANDYSRGFIEYCQFRAEIIKKGFSPGSGSKSIIGSRTVLF